MAVSGSGDGWSGVLGKKKPQAHRAWGGVEAPGVEPGSESHQVWPLRACPVDLELGVEHAHWQALSTPILCFLTPWAEASLGASSL